MEFSLIYEAITINFNIKVYDGHLTGLVLSYYAM